MKRTNTSSIILMYISMVLSLGLTAHGQTSVIDSALISLEKDMSRMAHTILYGDNDSVRFAASQRFTDQITHALSMRGSFLWPFDSLISIARLYAPDSSFRLFNWNLPKDDGTYSYSGILQMYDVSGNSTLYPLTDRSDGVKDLEYLITGHTEWPGAHYYQIVLNYRQRQPVYTLLGWDGHTPLTTRKTIEILTFDEEGRPVFGAPVFPDYQQGDQTRIIFEYSNHASMSLKYDLQTYSVPKKGRSAKKRYKTITTRMIVFDHLEPMDPSLAGQYSFYVPAGNIFDAFVFEDGYWRFHADIDAKNPESRDRIEKTIPAELDLFPPSGNK